jgi:hypothetical protein
LAHEHINITFLDEEACWGYLAHSEDFLALLGCLVSQLVCYHANGLFGCHPEEGLVLEHQPEEFEIFVTILVNV